MKKLFILGLIFFASATAQQTNVLEVLRWNCDPPDSIGYSKMYGTVQNIGSTDLKYLKVTAEYFKDAEKKILIGQKSSFVKADTLAPNTQTTFEFSTQISKFESCWLSFETDSGVLPTKYPDYSNNPPPRLP